MSVAVFGFGLNSFTGSFLNSQGYFKKVMYSALFAVLFNIIFNIVYLPKFGVIAAVYASIITEYSLFFLQALFIFILFKVKK